jgi:hypothetical protein
VSAVTEDDSGSELAPDLADEQWRVFFFDTLLLLMLPWLLLFVKF